MFKGFSLGLEASPGAWMVSVEVLEELYCGFKKFSCVIKPWSESGISKSLDPESWRARLWNQQEPGSGSGFNKMSGSGSGLSESRSILSESGSETLLNVRVKENSSRNCFCSVKILRELTHFWKLMWPICQQETHDWWCLECLRWKVKSPGSGPGWSVSWTT